MIEDPIAQALDRLDWAARRLSDLGYVRAGQYVETPLAAARTQYAAIVQACENTLTQPPGKRCDMVCCPRHTANKARTARTEVQP